MKTQLAFKSILTALLLTMHLGAFAQVPNYVPQNGLVGWWPFNGNANDESGNGNNGTVYGASLINDRFGNSGSAYDFNGTSSYIHLNNLIISSQSVSVSCWVNINDYSFNAPNYLQSIFYLGTEAGGGNPQTNSLSNYIDGINYNPPRIVANLNYSYGSCGFSSADSNWQNLVVVFDGALNQLQLYVNGTLIVSSSTTVNSIIVGINDINNIGASWNFISNIVAHYYKGAIDDFGVWNRALSQQEISSLHNAPNPNNSIPIFNCPGAFMSPNLASGLVGWWPFCGDADDESGNGNNGTVNGATLTTDRFGNANSAYSFDGATNYIEVQHSNSLNLRTQFSVSAWYITDSLVGNSSPYRPIMVSKERYLNGSGIQMGYGINQNTGLGINNDPIGPPLCPSCDLAVYGNQIIPSQWNHLVGVWDNDSLYLFHNSVLVGRANGALPNDSLLISTMPLLFGKAFTSLTPPYPTNFKGKLDDIGIWNRALDSSEVVQLYNTGICTQTVADCDTLIFDANITGFNPVTYANHVMVYPNPARDNLVIDCGSNYAGLNGYRIRIYNILGQPGVYVYDSPINSQYTYIAMASPWVNGTYIVEFLNPQGVVIDAKKIIVQ